MTATDLINTSSRRYKTGITPLVGSSEFDGLNPVRYIRRDNGKSEVGFIAEEVAMCLPEVVHSTADGVIDGIEYGKMVAVLTAKIKSQDALIAELCGSVANLRDDVKKLSGVKKSKRW